MEKKENWWRISPNEKMLKVTKWKNVLNWTRSIKTHGHVNYVATNLNYGPGSSERSAKRKKFRGGMHCEAFVCSFWVSRCFLSAIRRRVTPSNTRNSGSGRDSTVISRTGFHVSWASIPNLLSRKLVKKLRRKSVLGRDSASIPDYEKRNLFPCECQ
jgi:hypothetical protein